MNLALARRRAVSAILPHLGVLLGLSAVLLFLAVRYFKIRD